MIVYNLHDCLQFPWLFRISILRILYQTITRLTLTRPISLPRHTPVAQKIAYQRWHIDNSTKKGPFLYKMMWLKSG